MIKNILVSLLVLAPLTALALPDYPDSGRFKEWNVGSTDGYILKDTKTGCEYYSAPVHSQYVLLAGTCKPTVTDTKNETH